MFELKAKRLASVFLALIIALFAGCSGVKTDPLAPDPTASAASPAPVPTENASETASPVPTQAAPTDAARIGPPSDFFSLTMPESYEKYGIFSAFAFVSYENFYDDGKFYSVRYVNEDAASPYAASTLKYREYPDGDAWLPVCSDPLCTHTGAAGCPLAKCANLFSFAMLDGKVFFMGPDDALYRYDPLTNSSAKLMDRCREWRLFKQDGSIYVVYKIEDDAFNARFAALKAEADGSITELGSVSGLFTTQQNPVYADRYLIDSRFDPENTHNKAVMYLRDLETDELREVLELDYSDSGSIIPEWAYAVAVYGSRVLFRVSYMIGDSETSSVRNDEYWLFDIASGEKRLLCSGDDLGTNLLYSGKCIVFCDERTDDADPFLLHLLFVDTGEEQVFDLGAAAGREGALITKNADLISLNKGAVQLQCVYAMQDGIDDEGKPVYDMTPYPLLDYDLASGRIFFYDKPELPEFYGLTSQGSGES